MATPQADLTRKLITALSVMFVTTQIYASDVPHDRAFSSPKAQAVMTDKWKKKKLKYESKINNPDLVISLGQQTHPALQTFVKTYAKEKNLTIDIQQGSCGVTSRKLFNKTVDLGAFCCPPGKNDRLPGLTFHTIGIAPIALVVNQENPITNVTLSQARSIFEGNIVKWSELPQSIDTKDNEIPIRPVVRLHCKKRPGHWRLLLENEDKFSPRISEVGVIPDMISEVSQMATAIGYETLFMLDVHKKKGQLRVLKIDDMLPSDPQSLLDGRYPIYRTYNLTTWNDGINQNPHANELVRAIIQHIEEHGDDYGFISVSALKSAGWKFQSDEVIAEPDGTNPPAPHL